MKIKIAVLTVYPLEKGGGAEIVWKNLKDNIKDWKLDFYYLPQKIPNILHLKEIFFAPFLWKKIKRKKYDVIFYDKILGWCAPKSSVPKICYNHGLYSLAGNMFKEKNFLLYLFFKYFLSFFEKLSYKKSTKIVAVSETVKNETIGMGIPGSKIEVIYNGVDLKRFKPIKNKTKLRRIFGLPLNKKIILFLARASYGKGFDLSSKLMKFLDKKYLLVVTDYGKNKEKIKFIGKISQKKLPLLINAVDMAIFPSRYEGNSLALLECAACAVPVFSTPVGLMKEYEHDRNLQDFIFKNVFDLMKKIKNDKNIEKGKYIWLGFAKKFPLANQVKNFKLFVEKII